MACTFDDSDLKQQQQLVHDEYSMVKISLPDFSFGDSYYEDAQQPSEATKNNNITSSSTWKSNPNCLDKHSFETRMRTFLRIRANITMDEKYIIDGNGLQIYQPKNGKKVETYLFDQIFDGNSTQYEIFHQCALPLLKDILMGQNSLLFTFGVTSSGKTYTMKGNSQQPGIIPYSLVMLFNSFAYQVDITKSPQYKPIYFCDRIRLSEREQQYENDIRQFIIDYSLNKDHAEIEQFEMNQEYISKTHSALVDELSHIFAGLSSKNHDLSVWISYFEIYNDNIIDLLNVKSKNEAEPKLLLIQDRSNNYFINGLRQVFVTSATEAYLVYLYGQHNLKQHISQTALNDNSSRSHSIFRITMVRIDHTTQQSVTSNINFCDLAGAERIGKTGNTGQRAKETSKINQSLSALNHCISALNSKKRESMVVSFRASKLTHVLQPYLFSNGGSFCIIFNLNPSPKLFDESVYSLSFCDSIKAVQPTVSQSYVRRLTVRPDFRAKTELNMNEKLESVEEEKNEEVVDIQQYYEVIIEQKEEEFRQCKMEYQELIEELKQQFREMKRNHEEEMEEKKAIFNAKMDCNNDHFQSLLANKSKKIEELENKLFDNETELIELREKLEGFERLQKQFESLQQIMEDMNELICHLKSDSKKNNDQFEVLNKNLEKSLQEKEFLKKCVDKLERINQEKTQRLDDVEKELRRVLLQNDVLKTNVAASERMHQEKFELFEQLSKNYEKSLQENETLKTNIDQLERMNREKQEQMDQMKKKLERIEEEFEQLRKNGNQDYENQQLETIPRLPSDLLNSLSKRSKRKNNYVKEDLSMFSAHKKKAVLVERQISARKLKLTKSSPSDMLSPDTMFGEFQSEQKCYQQNQMENHKPYNTRSRKKLF